jgi:carbon-monoxide dehydrogenase large subunit
MSILGNRVLRKEDSRFLLGRGDYVENLPLEGALTITFVRSLLAHARIEGIDASAAEALPGVQVLTGADVDAGPWGPPPLPGLEKGMGRPLVAKDVARFVGDIVAIVVAEDAAAAADAAELVSVDYDPLPAVVSPGDAAKDETLLFPDVGSNVAARAGSPEFDEGLFDGCDAVVSGTLVSQRMAPCPLEPRSTAAEVGEDGRITAWLCTQTPHQDRLGLAGTLGVDPGQIRVVAPDVGGGFGAKMLSVEEILVVWLARRLGRPAR